MSDVLRHLVGLVKALFKIDRDFERKFRESIGQ